MSADKEVVRIGPLGAFFADGVRVGQTIYLAGITAIDTKGEPVGAGNIVAQTRQVYANLVEVLSKFGATPAHVVDETWFVTDVDDVMGKAREVFGVRGEVYGPNPPVTQTLIGVSRLFRPELLLEVKAVAHL